MTGARNSRQQEGITVGQIKNERVGQRLTVEDGVSRRVREFSSAEVDGAGVCRRATGLRAISAIP